MSSIIKVAGLSKRFIIDHEGERSSKYIALRDVIADKFRRKKNEARQSTEIFWALKDISFEIEQGDRVGIIGRNGAGKSTLLKVLSQITEPSEGSVRIRGRVASLLEVGTGFHPELTGRENIFLNGAILGMARAEIKRKFDEIVGFAEVEKFLDTPVKRYSSGMYVRLAFAVAAHLEPEILVIDEVLAVGDAQFQKKCLGKMEEISKGEGRTVIFVSHNMTAVKSLCRKGIVLDGGKVSCIGSVDEAVTEYLKTDSETNNRKVFQQKYDRSAFTLHEVSLNVKGKSTDEILTEYDEIELNTLVTIKKDHDRLHLTFVLTGETGEVLFAFSHINDAKKLLPGLNEIRCTFPKGFLNIGTYYLSVYMIEDAKRSIFTEKDLMSFSIVAGERPLGDWMGKEPGFIKPIFQWSIGPNGK
jgi:lipopolysaccharide transport system ATP-binding protein